MATYTHFAKQPDVLKHLILCEVLRNEAPQVYVETNSACAIYSMTQTPEQQYGIYHFLEKADDDKSLKDSIYYQLENIVSSLEKAGIKDYIGVELTMNSIRKDNILCNPGILGSGILATNVSQISKDTILDYSNKLVDIYKDAKYKDYDGSLYIQHL